MKIEGIAAVRVSVVVVGWFQTQSKLRRMCSLARDKRGAPVDRVFDRHIRLPFQITQYNYIFKSYECRTGEVDLEHGDQIFIGFCSSSDAWWVS